MKKLLSLLFFAAVAFPAEAQSNLGLCYYHGYGVEKSVEKTVAWYGKSAAQWRAAAQYNLGVCYENGEGVERDLEKARELYGKAAAQGYKPAIRLLDALNRATP